MYRFVRTGAVRQASRAGRRFFSNGGARKSHTFNRNLFLSAGIVPVALGYAFLNKQHVHNEPLDEEKIKQLAKELKKASGQEEEEEAEEEAEEEEEEVEESQESEEPAQESEESEDKEPETPKEVHDQTEEHTEGDVPASKVTEGTDEAETAESSDESTQEGESEDGEGHQSAAYNPETGEINWDCSCLGGMAYGPCGEEFKEAFACFVYSESEPKGIDCIKKFENMRTCFKKYPEHYKEELYEDETQEELVDTQAPAVVETKAEEAKVEETKAEETTSEEK